jgi:hypothetical protein
MFSLELRIVLPDGTVKIRIYRPPCSPGWRSCRDGRHARRCNRTVRAAETLRRSGGILPKAEVEPPEAGLGPTKTDGLLLKGFANLWNGPRQEFQPSLIYGRITQRIVTGETESIEGGRAR